MNRAIVAGYYIFMLVIFSLTLGFALTEYEGLIQFYIIMISLAVAYSVLIIGLVTFTTKTTLIDLKHTDTVTGSFLGLALLLFANFLFSYGYSFLYTSIYGTAPLVLFDLGLVPLQVSTFVIVSHVLIHMTIIAPTEEIIFRDLLPMFFYHPLKRYLPEKWAIGFAYSVSSVSYFGAAHLASTHFNPVLMGFIIFSSVVLAVIRVKYGLLSTTIAHIGNNLASVFF